MFHFQSDSYPSEFCNLIPAETCRHMEGIREQSFILMERRDKDKKIIKIHSKNKLLIISALNRVIMEY